ncbi:MAG: AAA family ATPase [Pseudomonadota bacterium]
MTGWTPDPVAAALALLPDRPGRRILGLIGPPGAGKSTLATALAAALDGAVLAMDGFHLDDAILVARGDRARKGAPHTFDVAGLAALLERLRAGGMVYAPVFDRAEEISRAAAVAFAPEVRTVVVEGNWLLHDAEGWGAIAPLLDASLYLRVDEDVLRQRLQARWAGYGLSDAACEAKVTGNDMPNARLVAASAVRADRILRAL